MLESKYRVHLLLIQSVFAVGSFQRWLPSMWMYVRFLFPCNTNVLILFKNSINSKIGRSYVVFVWVHTNWKLCFPTSAVVIYCCYKTKVVSIVNVYFFCFRKKRERNTDICLSCFYDNFRSFNQFECFEFAGFNWKSGLQFTVTRSYNIVTNKESLPQNCQTVIFSLFYIPWVI